MLPLQHDLRLSATKHITPAAAAARKIHAAIPLQSADIELHNTIELQQATVEHIAWMQQFQCTKHFMTCKTQKHSINKEQKKSPGTISYTARAVRERFHGKAATPETVAQAGQLFVAEPLFTRKNTMFRAHPSSQIASMMLQFHAIGQQ